MLFCKQEMELQSFKYNKLQIWPFKSATWPFSSNMIFKCHICCWPSNSNLWLWKCLICLGFQICIHSPLVLGIGNSASFYSCILNQEWRAESIPDIFYLLKSHYNVIRLLGEYLHLGQPLCWSKTRRSRFYCYYQSYRKILGWGVSW